ncbi:type II secretion system F family protein [Candidatus Parcubacteria bacterium]|nr:type II secretion system F family protein [Candidatus Parcubacteria bacterium]
MSTFVYTAINDQGEITSGELETVDIKAVTDYISRQGLTSISVKPKKDLNNHFTNLFSSGISQQEKIILTKHLSTMIKSGLSLKEGIETILNDTKKKAFKKVLTEAKFDLEKGQPLSVTFKKYPNFFSNIFIALIKAGESSGTLEKSLDYLGIQLKKDYKLKQKIKGAMAYPFVLIAASIAVIFIMMVFVVPKLTKVFAQSDLELPWTTQLIIKISDFISGNIYLIICFFIATSLSLLYFRKKKKVQNIISEIIFKIPFVSELYIKIILVRFIRTFGILLSSGINILKALDISAETVGYNKYHKAIKELGKEISHGVSISNSMRKRRDLFPYMLINMVSVGEKTGNLDSILNELATFYEEEVDNSIKNLVSLIEPLLLLVMGLIVAAIAFSVIMPIYQLVGSIN